MVWPFGTIGMEVVGILGAGVMEVGILRNWHSGNIPRVHQGCRAERGNFGQGVFPVTS